jgi:two-component system, chemotaxis family, protein-glutamate methylesterase/glutaminase
VATMHVTGAIEPPLRVVVVAATLARGRQLELILNRPGFLIVGVARGPEDAERLVTSTVPGAVLVDLALPGGGLEAIERIMAMRATPIVVCGDGAGQPDAALAAGAVDVVGPLDAPPGTAEFAEALRRHLKMASRVPVITHPRARLRAKRASGADSTTGPDLLDVPGEDPAATTRPSPAPKQAGTEHRRGRPVVVAIGASTGGPPALATILRELPADLDAAVLVVQHMAEGFLEGLARWLGEASALRVVVGVDGARVEPGTVFLAPAATNMLLRPGYRVALTEPSPGQFHVPGVDSTFHSVARVCGTHAVGVLLTGMGRDGAVGLRAMRDRGARTIGQDESSSVVYGMPAAALAAGAVDLELPLSAVATEVARAVGQLSGAAAEAGPGGPT